MQIAYERKLMNRRNVMFIAILVAARLGHADERSTREVDLFEYLQDLNALVKTGLSRAELGRRMPEMNIRFDRYVRSGGEGFGGLYAVVTAFRELEEQWDKMIRYKLDARDYDAAARYRMELLADRHLQLYFGSVQKALSNYEEERQSTIQKPQPQSQPRKSKK